MSSRNSNNSSNNNKGNTKVSARTFYSEYHGHKVKDLKIVYPQLRKNCDSLIWTAGDSSLDNKYWFDDHRLAVGVYRDVLDPPTSNADVTYWLNYLATTTSTQTNNNQNQEQQSQQQPLRLAAINTAVEATTLNERTRCLRPQDRFIRDNIQSNDVLVVSVGGNDVALAPLPCTIVSILGLVCMPIGCLENGCVAASAPCDDCCCGCGASLLSCTCALPPCLGYMSHLFGVRVQKYIEALTSKTRPRKILICMIYYPDENHVPSWAGGALGALGYNSNPEKLQLLIRRAFAEATSKIQIPGSETIPVPLFNALDGKNSRDYIARVEPSSTGGRKMAEYILNIINTSSSSSSAAGGSNGGYPSIVPTAVDRPLMSER